jgi:hypothetical protein
MYTVLSAIIYSTRRGFKPGARYITTMIRPDEKKLFLSEQLFVFSHTPNFRLMKEALYLYRSFQTNMINIHRS